MQVVLHSGQLMLVKRSAIHDLSVSGGTVVKRVALQQQTAKIHPEVVRIVLSNVPDRKQELEQALRSNAKQ